MGWNLELVHLLVGLLSSLRAVVFRLELLSLVRAVVFRLELLSALASRSAQAYLLGDGLTWLLV